LLRAELNRITRAALQQLLRSEKAAQQYSEVFFTSHTFVSLVA